MSLKRLTGKRDNKMKLRRDERLKELELAFLVQARKVREGLVKKAGRRVA